MIGIDEDNVMLYQPYLTKESMSESKPALCKSLKAMSLMALRAETSKHVRRSQDQWEDFFRA